MEVFFELHKDLPREGPGSDESTLRALTIISKAAGPPRRILDVGCGPGRQTLVLAKHTGAEITAVDTHQPYLDELRRRAERAGLSHRIATRNCSMKVMPFADESFDLVWAEGSIYLMGFEEGLRNWRRILTPGGCLAATEVAWLTPDPPAEVREFWNAAYPAIKMVDQILEAVRGCAYELLGHFELPESAWWDDYYCPLEKRMVALRERFAGDEAVLQALDAEQQEIDFYRRYSDVYGYVFYLARKPSPS